MRIAGINSSNYHISLANKPQNTQSHGQTVASDPSLLPQKSVPGNPTISGTQVNPKFVSQQKNSALMHSPALKRATGDIGVSAEPVRFYSRQHVPQSQEWSAYASDGWSAASPVLDKPSYKAQAAIAEYMRTQFIEERMQFEAAVGVDDYA